MNSGKYMTGEKVNADSSNAVDSD